MLKPIEKHDQNDQTTLSNNRRQTVSSDPNEELIREREMCFDLFDDRSCRRCKRYIVFAKVNLRGIKRIPWHGGKDELARILSIGYYGNTFSYVVVKRRGEGAGGGGGGEGWWECWLNVSAKFRRAEPLQLHGSSIGGHTAAVSESRRPRIESDTVIEKETNVRGDPSVKPNPNINFTRVG